MKRAFVCAYKTHIFFIAFALLCDAAYASGSITIVKGMQKIFPVTDVVSFSISNPRVANVQLTNDKRHLIITAFETGYSSLATIKKDQSIEYIKITVQNIRKKSLSQKQKDFMRLKRIEKLRISQVQDKTYLNGSIQTSRDLKYILWFIKKYPDTVNATRFSKQNLKSLQMLLQRKLYMNQYTSIQSNICKQHLCLSGRIYNKHEFKHIKNIALSIYPLIRTNIKIKAEQNQMILLDLKFVEIHKNAHKSIGIRWPGQYSIQSNLSFQNNAFSHAHQSAQNFSTQIDLLAENGKAKILSNPKLLCYHNKTSSFFAGGEMPIRLISERSASITYKPYGINIQSKPKILPGKQIEMSLNISISDLNAASSIEGLPGIVEHKIQTHALLNFGQTKILGGLYENRSKKNVYKTPFLNQLPILGELFKSRQFQNRQSEFYIFITPYPANNNKAYHSRHFAKATNMTKNSHKTYKASFFD